MPFCPPEGDMNEGERRSRKEVEGVLKRAAQVWGDRIALLVCYFPHQNEKISSLARFSFIKRQGNPPGTNEINQPPSLVKFRFGLLGSKNRLRRL